MQKVAILVLVKGARGMDVCSSPAHIACFSAGLISSHRVQSCCNCFHFFWFLDKIFRNLFLNMILAYPLTSIW